MYTGSFCVERTFFEDQFCGPFTYYQDSSTFLPRL